MQVNQATREKVGVLIAVLEDQIRIYRTLLDVVRKEKEILIAANLDELNENNRSKEAMLLKIRALEADRLAAAGDVCSGLQMSDPQPRLLEISRYLDSELSDKLRNIHSVLELLLRRVQEYNKQNEALVAAALSNITGAMKSLKNSLSEKPTYQKKGEVEGSTSAGQLVSREA